MENRKAFENIPHHILQATHYWNSSEVWLIGGQQVNEELSWSFFRTASSSWTFLVMTPFRMAFPCNVFFWRQSFKVLLSARVSLKLNSLRFQGQLQFMFSMTWKQPCQPLWRPLVLFFIHDTSINSLIHINTSTLHTSLPRVLKKTWHHCCLPGPEWIVTNSIQMEQLLSFYS